jgi:hypothetical protein
MVPSEEKGRDGGWMMDDGWIEMVRTRMYIPHAGKQ